MYQDNYFVVSVKINFCQRQTKCIDDQDKFQSVKDTDNEFTECQTPKKKLQSIGISPVSVQAFMKSLKSDVSEAYKVKVDCSESVSYDKNDMKEKVNGLVRFHKALQGKLKPATYSGQNQILALVPDKWYILISLNTLFELNVKLKK